MENKKSITLHNKRLLSFKEIRLALNVGTDFIGWALYRMDKNKKPDGILGSGVRIFSSGRRAKDFTTLNAIRRKARLQRRQRDRYLQRRNYLLHLLKKHGLFPEDAFSSKKLSHLNPYQLRAKGLDEKLDIYHFGRSLFHLNQKRGFKKNRKSKDVTESGLINKSIKNSQELMKQYNSRTYGELLWKRFQEMEEKRKTPGSQQKNWIVARKALGAGSMESYPVYSSRQMVENEFHQLWDSQARFHGSLKNKKLKDLFFKVIFYQRPLKNQLQEPVF